MKDEKQKLPATVAGFNPVMFPIRHKTSRELEEAFSENEEFFLVMIGQILPLSGVYSVGFFDKQFWMRA